MRSNVVGLLKDAGLDAMAVENPCNPGTPDVNLVEGWIELKQLPKWPKRGTTTVRIEHFTQVQRMWLARRWDKGGNVYLLLQVRQDWLLFSGEDAADHVGKATEAELGSTALRTWTGLSQLKKELPLCLSRSPRPSAPSSTDDVLS